MRFLRRLFRRRRKGIVFGGDTNLYRSATLQTQDKPPVVFDYGTKDKTLKSYRLVHVGRGVWVSGDTRGVWVGERGVWVHGGKP